MVKQISIFLENRKGRLAYVCKILGEAEINIRALSIADTTDFGVLRLIVNDPDKAYEILTAKGLVTQITDVLAIEVSDTPGALGLALEKLDQAGISVEYMYAFLGSISKDALVIIRVENPEEAIDVIKKAGINVLDGERVYAL
ncbi:MAG: ACT domain-containing protein [Peptococcia bacterium]